MDNRGIGIFDSGFGGLTVVKEIKKILPNEKIYYFGDTARLPYGSKSKESIITYSEEIANFLKTKNIKALVIACNSASAVALDILKDEFDFPVIGVIGAGSRGALKVSSKENIGVIGTKVTIKSNIYEETLKNIKGSADVYSVSCPLFVPLVEEGMIEDDVTKIMIDRYLSNFKGRVDSLILGCTHYPILEDEIKIYLKDTNIKVVNPAIEVALELQNLLKINNQFSEDTKEYDEFYVSDSPLHFKKLGEMFLGSIIHRVKKINLEEY